jgi:hypothetical protein
MRPSAENSFPDEVADHLWKRFGEQEIGLAQPPARITFECL